MMNKVLEQYKLEQKFIEEKIMPVFEPEKWIFDIRFVPTGTGNITIYGFKDVKDGNDITIQRRAAHAAFNIDLVSEYKLNEALDSIIAMIGFEMDNQKNALVEKYYE